MMEETSMERSLWSWVGILGRVLVGSLVVIYSS